MKKVISIEHLSKIYKIGHQQKQFREFIANPFRNSKTNNESEKLFALNDISLSIYEGDTVGLIGPNGAGKSTLLKILSRITTPTKGKVKIRGRISSLLEVGTGFHPELTGRENIFLNGAVLGMRQNEIKRKFDEIVAFSGVEKFLDTQLKHFSSGMQARLAFAIAAHLDPEILLVDEVLAVGDVEFQKKCLGKMNEIGKKGNTVIFVSHNMSAITGLCKKCVLLENGKVQLYGDAVETVSKYLSRISTKELSLDIQKSQKKKLDNFYFTHIELLNSHLKHTATVRFKEPFKIKIRGIFIEPVENLVFNITISSLLGNQIYNSMTSVKELKLQNYKGEIELTLDMNSNIFGSGAYAVTLSCGGDVAIEHSGIINFTVADSEIYEYPHYIPYQGFAVLPRNWKVSKLD